MTLHRLQPYRDHTGSQPDTQPEEHPLTLSNILGCTLACMPDAAHPDVPPSIQPDDHTAIQAVLAGVRCSQGHSPAQINTLSILLSNQGRVLSYYRLAEELLRCFWFPASRDAVRGYVTRLRKRKYLVHHQGREGLRQGAVYTMYRNLICPHIVPAHPAVPPDNQPKDHAASHPGVDPDLSNSIRQTEENLSVLNNRGQTATSLLSITDEDIGFNWPGLFKAGFGSIQIQQICENLKTMNKPLDRVLTGLDHAEYELTNGIMFDAAGTLVDSPLNYVFQSLKKNGYYRKPAGYISPAEQFELDALEESKRVKKLQEKRLLQEFDIWRNELTPSNKSEILGEKERFGGPTEAFEAILREHFRKYIWPERTDRRSTNQSMFTDL